jgi:hypothetical protein
MPKDTTIRFDSFDAFVAAASPPSPTANADDGSRASRTEWDTFYGYTSEFEDAIGLATTGWAEGAKRCNALRASIDSLVREAVVAKQAGYGWEVTGDAVDVGKYLSGEPECWLTQVPDGESTAGPIVRLVANIAASASVGAESLFSRGAIVFAAIDLLESLGHRVELTVARGTTVKGKTLEIFVPVKSANQPLDSDRLAFCLCSPAFLRRLTWSVSEHHGFIPKHTKPAPVNIEHGEVLALDEARRPQDFTKQELFDHVRDLCEKCGVTIG